LLWIYMQTQGINLIFPGGYFSRKTEVNIKRTNVRFILTSVFFVPKMESILQNHGEAIAFTYAD